jgi:hypothetical protein
MIGSMTIDADGFSAVEIGAAAGTGAGVALGGRGGRFLDDGGKAGKLFLGLFLAALRTGRGLAVGRFDQHFINKPARRTLVFKNGHTDSAIYVYSVYIGAAMIT